MSWGKYLPEILHMINSLRTSFVDRRAELLRSLAEWMTKLNEWFPRLSEEVKMAIHALFDQVGAFATGLKSFFTHGATRYIPDFHDDLFKLNQEIHEIDEKSPGDALFILQGAYDKARKLFHQLLVGIKTAQTENKWIFVGLVGTSAAIGGAIGVAVGAPIAVEAFVAASTPTVWGSIASFLGFGGATSTGAAVTAGAIAATPVVVGCAAVGTAVGGIGYVQKKRNENEIIRVAKLQAIDLRDIVCKIKRSAQRLLFDMNTQDRTDMCLQLIANLETLENDIMVGVLDL